MHSTEIVSTANYGGVCLRNLSMLISATGLSIRSYHLIRVRQKKETWKRSKYSSDNALPHLGDYNREK